MALLAVMDHMKLEFDVEVGRMNTLFNPVDIFCIVKLHKLCECLVKLFILWRCPASYSRIINCSKLQVCLI